VLKVGSDDYKSTKWTYWVAREQELNPGCFVKPASAQEVSTVIKILREPEHLTDEACKFAVRGGGHMTWAGAANIGGGVTIDMTGMKEVNIATDKKKVSVGAGNRWLDVYNKVEPQGLAVSGGRWGHVSVPSIKPFQ
jgi:FAD/FMN-containing dehydrogenase